MTPSIEASRFITDSNGNRIGVILDLERYEELLDAMEELEDIRAFDAAKAVPDTAIPFEQAIREIENGRK